jgi:hypothetical protein
VELPPIVVGERSVRPVARVSGWRAERRDPAGGGAGAWLRLAPVAVVVREPDGRERRLALADGTGDALRGLAAAALAVAAACWAIRWLMR